MNLDRGATFKAAAVIAAVFLSIKLRAAIRAFGNGKQTQNLTLEPVINFPAGGAGSQFLSGREARNDEYWVSSSDE